MISNLRRIPSISLLLVLLTFCQQKKDPEKFGFNKPQKAEVTKFSRMITVANKGVGPIETISLSPKIDTMRVKRGVKVYHEKCTACHQVGRTFIGPPPNGILQRRSPEWIMNLLLNTEEMLQKDSTAKGLFMEFDGQLMTNQNLSESEARDILEYFRTLD